MDPTHLFRRLVGLLGGLETFRDALLHWPLLTDANLQHLNPHLQRQLKTTTDFQVTFWKLL